MSYIYIYIDMCMYVAYCDVCHTIMSILIKNIIQPNLSSDFMLSICINTISTGLRSVGENTEDAVHIQHVKTWAVGKSIFHQLWDAVETTTCNLKYLEVRNHVLSFRTPDFDNNTRLHIYSGKVHLSPS